MGGVLPYTRTNPYTGVEENNKIWVNLGLERGGPNKGTWDMYSGKADFGESSFDAAAREAAEESCEMLGTKEAIQKFMYPLNGSQSSFLLKVSNPMEINQEAFKARKLQPKYKRSCFQEKTCMKWVNLADLVDACVNKQGVLGDMVIRPYFARVIKKNSDYLTQKINNVAVNICKTPVDKLNPKKINPFQINFIENKQKRTSEEQANEIVDYFLNFFEKNPQGKLGITHSTGAKQAEKIYEGKLDIEGRGQAGVFSLLSKTIRDLGWETQVHILPIAATNSQKDVEKSMQYIAEHIKDGWVVLGLQNQGCTAKSPFAIGNAEWKGTPQEKYANKYMLERL